MWLAMLVTLLFPSKPLLQPKAMSREILTLPPPAFDHRLSYGAAGSHFGHLRLPPGKGPHPVVIVVHGGFWRAAYDLGYAGHMSAALTAHGVATWNIEYRRVGQPGGGYPGTLDDVAAAADHLTAIAAEYPLDLKRVVAIGHSAGGHLALWLASRRNGKVTLSGAVSLAGVADLRHGADTNMGSGAILDFMGGPPAQFPDRYRAASPIERLPVRVPTSLIHGAKDTTVPLENASRFEKAAKAAGDDSRLIPLPDAGHFELVDPRTSEWKIVEKTVLGLLGH